VKIRHLIQKVNELPTLPGVLLEIESILKNESTDIEKVSSLIERDQSLTTNLLRFANSPYYGLSYHVDTVKKAVVVLGLNSLWHFLVRASVFTFMSKSESISFDAQGLWRHSLSSAVATKALVGKTNQALQENAFICGLIHDIGKVAIARYLPREMQKVLERIRNSHMATESEIENEVLGFTHAHVGALLGKKWRLPKEYVEITQLHHAPQYGSHAIHPHHMLLRYSVYAANQIVKALSLGRSTDEKAKTIASDTWRILGITKEDFPEIIYEIKSNFDRIATTWS